MISLYRYHLIHTINSNGDATLTLWILFCRMNARVDTLFPFYAKDREDAEQKAEEILAEYGYERLDLKAYPGGFRIVRMHIPGVIERDAG